MPCAPRSLRSLGRALALFLPLLLLGVGSCDRPPIAIGLPSLAGSLPVEIRTAAGVDPASVVIALDGIDVTHLFAPTADGYAGSIPVPPPGTHRISFSRDQVLLLGVAASLTTGRIFDVPAPAPEVVSIVPAAGATVARTAWLRFQLAGAAAPDALAGFGFALECGGRQLVRSAHALADGTLVLNPTPELPAGSSCRAVWRASDGSVAERAFATAADAPGAAATMLYDRTDPLAVAPFPDDYWTVPDASSLTGVTIDLPTPPFSDLFQLQAFEALGLQVQGIDGWSRMTPIVVALSHALDPSVVPADEAASIDPLAVASLVDVDPASPDFGQRVPYRMVARSDGAWDGTTDHAALIFPTLDLRERGRYAFVLRRSAFASGAPGRPFAPSGFFAAVLAPPDAADSVEVARARDRVDAALVAAAGLEVPIPREDVALAVAITVRTQPAPTDLVYFKEQALAAPPPELVLPSLANPCPNANNFCIRVAATRALEIRGRVRLPDHRHPETRLFIRDETSGLPIVTRTLEVPFMMSLPLEALDGPVPIVMYQHGNPGSALEAVRDLATSGTAYLDDAGWAVAGITDTLNREIGQDVALQVQFILLLSVSQQQLPDFWNETGGNMISFLRAIQGMGSLDLMHRGAGGLPELGPDGIPEIDPSRILYHGISEGGNNAQRFLPFAPEIIAATPTVGGARLGETIIHQSGAEILDQIDAFLPELRPNELWVGLSLFQHGFDYQDGHTFLRHLYHEPLLPFAGSSDVTPPSTLWTEGIGDTLVPNNASRAAAREVGAPQVDALRVVPGLDQETSPLSENLGPGTTTGYFQYDPATTPYCMTAPEPEGHYCPQRAPEARAQRRHFLETGLDGAAEIIAPF